MFNKCECDNGPFIVMLQVTYSVNKFAFIPVIIGAMGAIPIDLKLNIKRLGFDENEAAKLRRMI